MPVLCVMCQSSDTPKAKCLQVTLKALWWDGGDTWISNANAHDRLSER